MPHENLDAVELRLPYALCYSHWSHVLFFRGDLKKEIQEKVGIAFIKTPKMYMAFAELYLFGTTPSLPNIVCEIDAQKAAYWHAWSLFLLGKEAWTASFDKHLFDLASYKNELIAFIDEDARLLNRLEGAEERAYLAELQYEENRLEALEYYEKDSDEHLVWTVDTDLQYEQTTEEEQPVSQQSLDIFQQCQRLIQKAIQRTSPKKKI